MSNQAGQHASWSSGGVDELYISRTVNSLTIDCSVYIQGSRPAYRATSHTPHTKQLYHCAQYILLTRSPQ
jgi:hypothetical protein